MWRTTGRLPLLPPPPSLTATQVIYDCSRVLFLLLKKGSSEASLRLVAEQKPLYGKARLRRGEAYKVGGRVIGRAGDWAGGRAGERAGGWAGGCRMLIQIHVGSRAGGGWASGRVGAECAHKCHENPVPRAAPPSRLGPRAQAPPLLVLGCRPWATLLRR